MTEILNNEAIYNGGAIYASYSTLSLKNSKLSSNTAYDGGAIYCTNYSVINIYNTTMTNNVAEIAAVADCNKGCLLTATQCKINDNNSTSGDNGTCTI